MMKKLCKIFVAMMILTLFGCGTNNNAAHDNANDGDEQITVGLSNDMFEKNETGDKGNNIDTEVSMDKQEILIDEAKDFSGGYAWIKLEDNDNWYCINTSGEVLFNINCWNPSNFIGNYADVDNTIINNLGEAVFSYEDEGYQLVYSDSFDVGIAILSKELESFEKSGTFYYSLDLNSKEIREIDFSDCEYFTTDSYEQSYSNSGYHAELKEYIGLGYYSIALAKNYGTEIWSPWVYKYIQLYDSRANKIVNIETGVGELYRAGISFFHTLVRNELYVVYDDIFQLIDLDSLTIKKTISDDFHYSNQRLLDKYLYEYYDVSIWSHDIVSGKWYCDLSTGEVIQLITPYDDSGYDVLFYQNGFFILSVKNDAGSSYITAVNKNGECVYQPALYDTSNLFEPQLVGNRIVYHDGTKLYFVSTDDWQILNEYETEIRCYPKERKCFAYCYDENDVGFTIVMGDDWHYTYYDTDGKIICENLRSMPSENGVNNGYLRVGVSEDFYEFWDSDGKKLKIDF